MLPRWFGRLITLAVTLAAVMGCDGSGQENCELCGPPIRLIRAGAEDIKNVTTTGPCQVTYCGAEECGIIVTKAGACHLAIAGISGRTESQDIALETSDIHWDACCASYYFSTGAMVLPVLAAASP